MNSKEPHSFAELEAWLSHIVKKAGYRAKPLAFLSRMLARNAPSVEIWLSGFESQHAKAIQKAITDIWLHEAEVFRDLPPDPASLLRLRIELSRADRGVCNH